MSEAKLYDVVIIGGGASGLMSAGRAGELGRSVLLFEKNNTLGKKLLITGGGRCNLTNNKINIRDFISKYKGKNKFLFSCFSQFGVTETLEFFNSRNMFTKVEAEDRVFPVSNKAQSVWDCLYKYIQKNNIKVKSGVKVVNIEIDKNNNRFCILLENNLAVYAKSCVVATGGTSHPETGSTGDGFLWLKKLGHKVVENNFALVPVALKDAWVKKLSGVVLKDIKLTLYANNKKVSKGNLGKVLFTHFGISGPMVLNMSKSIGDQLLYNDVVLFLDLFPKLDILAIKQKFQELLTTYSNKKLKNILGQFIPSSLVNAMFEITGINPEVVSHSLVKEDRKKLVLLFKAIPLNVKGLLGEDKAVISSGGVDPTEVDFKTMESKVVPNLYLVGDILNIDRPSGGYSLQLCWSTGFVAGSNV